MTIAELRTKLSIIEPTESMYAGITQADVPVLEQLLSDGEAWIAARAVFALSRVGTADAVRLLSRAAADSRSEIRVAVSAAAGQRPITLPDSAVVGLLQDQDPGVRKFATFAVKDENGPEPRAILNRLATDDVMPVVRESATEVLRKLR